MQKKENQNMPDVNVNGLNVKEIHQEGVNELPDDMLRRTMRGNEAKGNPDNRDIVGGVDSSETPQGREESKNDTGSKANKNG